MIKNPKPMHPGKVLATIYMPQLNLNQSQLAALIGCAPRKINEIVNGKCGSLAPKFKAPTPPPTP